MLYEWGGNKPADSVMTPDERANAIRQYEQEIDLFNVAFEWQACFDDDPKALARRKDLSSLIHAMEERIAELRR